MQRLNKDNNALRGTHHPGKVHFSTQLIQRTSNTVRLLASCRLTFSLFLIKGFHLLYRLARYTKRHESETRRDSEVTGYVLGDEKADFPSLLFLV